jgi:iron complex outermembrane receptor protein
MAFSSYVRSCLLLGASLTAALFATPVLAQDSDSGYRLEEIVVTAQKREQRLQDVPIAVTAVAGEALVANRITNVVDLSAIAPGVTVRPSLGASSIPSFTIRGAVSYGVVPGSDKQVSMYLDGVYLSSPRGAIFDLPNIERIEMLRGPQGTLFGRNATAGAVSITTQDPRGEGHVRASVSHGNLDLERYELTAHSPELGPFSGYLSYVKNKHRGSVRNGMFHVFDRSTNALKYKRFAESAEWLGGKDSESIFASAKFESGDFKAVYKYDRNELAQTPDAVGIFAYDARLGLGSLFGSYVNAIIDGNVANGLPIATDRKRPREVWNSYNTSLDVLNQGHSLRLEYQVNDQISIKNIAAYRSSWVESTASLLGIDALPIPASAIDEFATLTAFSTVPGFATLPAAQQGAILTSLQGALQSFVGRTYCVFCSGPNSRSKQWSDELQINYDSDFVTLTVGGMYFLGKDHINEHGMQNTVTFTALPPGNVIPYLPGIGYNEAKSLAAYAQGEFHVTRQLDIVLGGRYTKDKKVAELTSLSQATCPTTVTDTRTCPLVTSVFNYKDTKFNYLIGVNFKPNDDTLIYAKYSTAYVSGGKVGPIEFVPETTKSAEAGVKADLLGRRLRTNLSVFWAKYYDYQTAQGGNVFPQELLAGLVPDARIRAALGTFVFPQGDIAAKGFELEVTAAPVDRVVLGGSLSYTDIKFSNVPGVLKQAQNLPATAPDSDYLPTFRPDWTASAYAQYTSEPIWGDAFFTARVQGNYQSSMRVHANENIETIVPLYTETIPGYWLINARVALERIKLGGFDGTLAVWGKNITNNRSMSFGFNQVGIASGTFIEPRRYGVDLTVEF